MKWDYLLGCLLGIVLVVAIWLLARKREKKDGGYDERQLALRAEGYRRSFFVTLFAEVFVILLLEIGAVPPASATLALFVAIMIGIVTFAVYCVVKDVFFHIGQNEVKYMTLCAVIVVLDGIVTGVRIADGSLMEKGVPTFESCSSLVMGLSFLVILIALLVRRHSGEDDE